MSPTRPRLAGDRILGSRRAAALLVRRHPDQVRQQCRPIACDATTRAMLYDLDDVEQSFANTPRRSVS